jgi:hypothetical protein
MHTIYRNNAKRYQDWSGGKDMNSKKLIQVLTAGLLACALISTHALAQVQLGGKSTTVQENRGIKVTVQGIIKPKMGGGYVIRSRPEVLSIANPIPTVLEPLAKSGETVSIEALASGDLLTIQAINGKKYQNTPTPVSK